MNAIFMNSEKIKTSESHRLLINLSHKLNLKSSNKYVVLSNLIMYYKWENMKKSYKNNKFKYLLQRGMKSLNYLMDHILYLFFKIILSILSKNHPL